MSNYLGMEENGRTLHLCLTHRTAFSLFYNNGSWFTIDIERTMIERNIAFKVWRRRKTTLERERFISQRKRVDYLAREAKRLYMKRYLDPNSDENFVTEPEFCWSKD
jgi:hypothetical protein